MGPSSSSDRIQTMRVRPTTALALAALLALAAPAAAQDMDHGMHGMHHGTAADSAAVAQVVTAFHEALAAGDSARALALLAPEARILEGGGVETRAEYASHHLGADMAFASAVPRERGALEVRVMGDVAWVTSDSRVQGTYREREIDARGSELAVLARHDGEWKIEAVSWTSR